MIFEERDSISSPLDLSRHRPLAAKSSSTMSSPSELSRHSASSSSGGNTPPMQSRLLTDEEFDIQRMERGPRSQESVERKAPYKPKKELLKAHFLSELKNALAKQHERQMAATEVERPPSEEPMREGPIEAPSKLWNQGSQESLRNAVPYATNLEQRTPRPNQPYPEPMPYMDEASRYEERVRKAYIAREIAEREERKHYTHQWGPYNGQLAHPYPARIPPSQQSHIQLPHKINISSTMPPQIQQPSSQPQPMQSQSASSGPGFFSAESPREYRKRAIEEEVGFQPRSLYPSKRPRNEPLPALEAMAQRRPPYSFSPQDSPNEGSRVKAYKSFFTKALHTELGKTKYAPQPSRYTPVPRQGRPMTSEVYIQQYMEGNPSSLIREREQAFLNFPPAEKIPSDPYSCERRPALHSPSESLQEQMRQTYNRPTPIRTVATVTEEMVDRELALSLKTEPLCDATSTLALPDMPRFRVKSPSLSLSATNWHRQETVAIKQEFSADVEDKGNEGIREDQEMVPKRKSKKGRKPKPKQPQVLSYGPRKKTLCQKALLESKNPSLTGSVTKAMAKDEQQHDEKFKDRSSTCKICSAVNESYHLNYGVSTCFSCRAFFRRTVQKNLQDKLKCRRNGGCQITPTCRDCRMCRYRRCIDMGMLTSQVMDDQQKLVRFRRRIKRNRRESPAEEDTMSQEKVLLGVV